MRAPTKKKGAVVKKVQTKVTFGGSLAVEQLVSLTAELQKLRHHPPITRREAGKYEGDILGFVKGLRLSARVIYFLREYLSEMDFEVSWGPRIERGRAILLTGMRHRNPLQGPRSQLEREQQPGHELQICAG